MCGSPNQGPSFGMPDFGDGYELGLGATLGCDASDGSGYVVGDHGVYACPVGQDGGTLLTGTRGFRAAEVEVYQVVLSPEQQVALDAVLAAALLEDEVTPTFLLGEDDY